MNKAVKKFRSTAVLAVFILLTVLLTVINGVNFTMASQDADSITQSIADSQGSFQQGGGEQGGSFKPMQGGNKMGPMGPGSPDMNSSVRYFTFAFRDENGDAERVAFQISAVTEEEAAEWARSLMNETTGWTHGTYRYRVYNKGDSTYVTVIDQGRELLPSYRILIISAVGEALVVLISWLVLGKVGEDLFSPLEEADRKQKRFIADADREFRLPLTIIAGDTELIERSNGPDDHTRSIRRQTEKLNDLVKRLGNMSIFDEDDLHPAQVPLSEFLQAALDGAAAGFEARGIEVETDIAPDVQISADPEAVRRIADELVGNAVKYAKTRAKFSLKKENDRVLLDACNDTDLPEGQADQVFDRFTVLENAAAEEGSGLGLSYVKDAVKAHHGRVSAAVEDGEFRLRVAL